MEVGGDRMRGEPRDEDKERKKEGEGNRNIEDS